MPDGGSQSPITMRLNLLSNYRTRKVGMVEANLRTILEDRTIRTKDIVTKMIDSIVIASSKREIDHVEGWPDAQLEILRNVIIEAIRQERPTFYDWQFEDDAQSMTIRDNGLAVYITFRSRPDA
jgi:hypothetical protein